jgi:hypothetical protein
MNNRTWEWIGAVIFFLVLITFFILNSIGEIRSVELCKSMRIRPFVDKFFTWQGMLDLNKTGEYQPKCI